MNEPINISSIVSRSGGNLTVCKICFLIRVCEQSGANHWFTQSCQLWVIPTGWDLVSQWHIENQYTLTFHQRPGRGEFVTAGWHHVTKVRVSPWRIQQVGKVSCHLWRTHRKIKTAAQTGEHLVHKGVYKYIKYTLIAISNKSRTSFITTNGNICLALMASLLDAAWIRPERWRQSFASTSTVL